MSDVVADNPMTRLYDAVFNLLFDDPTSDLSQRIKKGNRISLGTAADTDRDMLKQQVASADTPELFLIDEGVLLNFHQNSSSTGWTQNLSIYCSTGDFRLFTHAYAINWGILCNMSAWRTSLGALRWRTSSYVKNFKVVPIQLGLTNPMRETMIAGWTCIWRMQFDCTVLTTDLVTKE